MISTEIDMERSRIFVSGFPDGTTKSELTVYFQSKRSSGGGDVERIDFDEGRAIVTFEDVLLMTIPAISLLNNTFISVVQFVSFENSTIKYLNRSSFF